MSFNISPDAYARELALEEESLQYGRNKYRELVANSAKQHIESEMR